MTIKAILEEAKGFSSKTGNSNITDQKIQKMASNYD